MAGAALAANIDASITAMFADVLIYSMSVSIDGFINDRHGAFAWGKPSDELFAFHLERIRGLSAHLCGRRLYQTMLVWETDPSMRATAMDAEFAGVWTALPKVVFSRTGVDVQGQARLANRPLLAELIEVDSEDMDIEIGGATLAATALAQDLVDELRIFRVPVVVGGGTAYLPPLPSALPFNLMETRRFGGGVLYERYRRPRSR